MLLFGLFYIGVGILTYFPFATGYKKNEKKCNAIYIQQKLHEKNKNI